MTLKLLGCNVIKNQCNVLHCHVCKRETDYPCCCADCGNEAGQAWVYHYYEHLLKNDFKPEECNMCDIHLRSLKSE